MLADWTSGLAILMKNCGVTVLEKSSSVTLHAGYLSI